MSDSDQVLMIVVMVGTLGGLLVLGLSVALLERRRKRRRMAEERAVLAQSNRELSAWQARQRDLEQSEGNPLRLAREKAEALRVKIKTCPACHPAPLRVKPVRTKRGVALAVVGEDDDCGADVSTDCGGGDCGGDCAPADCAPADCAHDCSHDCTSDCSSSSDCGGGGD